MNTRKGLSCSEAGRMGAEITREIQRAKKQTNIEQYNQHPILCLHCKTPISYDRRFSKFCNASCAAKYNNAARAATINKTDAELKHCENCGVVLNAHQTKYCSGTCQREYQWKQRKNQIELAGEFPCNKRLNDTYRTVARKFIEERTGHVCSICGKSEWNGKPIPLVADHIDGDSTNHKIENIRLVCANCDAQLETFKARNHNSTRTWRKQYYASTNISHGV